MIGHAEGQSSGKDARNISKGAEGRIAVTSGPQAASGGCESGRIRRSATPWFYVINVRPRTENLDPAEQFGGELPAPARLEDLALLQGPNLKQVQTLAYGGPKNVTSNVTRSDLSGLKGLKSYLVKSEGSPRNTNGNFLVTLKMVSRKVFFCGAAPF